MRALRLLTIICILPIFTVMAQTNHYVTMDGANKMDGTNWENALNATQFVDDAASGLYEKDTFLLGEGKYLLKSDVQLPLMSNLKGSDVDESVISGSIATQDSNCVTVQVQAPVASEISLDGVVLESAAKEAVVIRSSGDGSAVILKGCVLRKAEPRNCDDQLVTENYKVWVGSGIVPLGHIFDKIGRFIEDDVWVNNEGCNVTTRYVVDVLPMPKTGTHDYYVKQNGSGKKDGSSWADAMSDSAFAYSFGKVEAGATFHIAAGNYFPYCDSCYINPYADSDLICRWFHTDKLVNIVGGYPADAEENAVTDTSNHTVFCTSVREGDNEYNSIRLFSIEPSTSGDVNISGVDFKAIQSFRGMNGENCALRVRSDVKGVTLDLKLCRFEGLGQALLVSSCAVRAEDCDFDDCVVGIYGGAKDEMVMNRCSGALCDLSGGKIMVSNTTFNNMTVGSASVANITHSTIMGLICSESVSAANLVGNIVRNLTILSEEELPVVTSSYNLFGKETDETELAKITSSDQDIMVDPIALDSILDHDDYSARKAHNKRAFTKTIALLSDTLLDGRSIRYNRQDASEIEIDQCGFVRPDLTCPGAYEYQHDATTTLPMVDVAEEVALSDIMCSGCVTRFYDALGRCVAQTSEGWEVFRTKCTLQTGLYIYVVTTPEGKRYRGKVTLNGAE